MSDDRESLPVEIQDAINALGALDGTNLSDSQKDELSRVLTFEAVKLCGIENVSVAVRWFEKKAEENAT